MCAPPVDVSADVYVDLYVVVDVVADAVVCMDVQAEDRRVQTG